MSDPISTMAGEEGIDPAAGPEASRKFRNALGQFATGVTVMTTVTPTGEDVGMTVNSFSSPVPGPAAHSLEPGQDRLGLSLFQIGDSFAVNVIAVDQEPLARQLARSSGDKFVGIELHRGLGRVPLLAGCVAYLECVTEARHPGGDHEIIVGRVRRLFNIGHPPLLFHRGIFHVLGNPRTEAK